MGRSRLRTRLVARPAAAAGVACAVVLIAGCAPATRGAGAKTSATPSANAATTSPPVPCGTLTSLRTALTNLIHIRPTAEASGQIAADLISVRAQLEALKTTTGAYAAKTRPLDQAVDHVGSAASAALSDPSSATLAALVSALDGLKASLPPMIAEMKAVCPTS
jgi:hypothetical protein